jgi:haloalkane dehalogenase
VNAPGRAASTGSAGEHDQHPLPGEDLVVRGVRLRVARYGRSDALPVLAIHGLPTSGYLWHGVMRDLGRRRLVVAPDLIGLGWSERPATGPYGLQDQAALLASLLDDLDLPRVAVAGHDLGGAVAVHLAVARPERVAALLLFDSPLTADCWPVPQVLPLLPPGLGEICIGALRRTPTLARLLLGRALAAGGGGRLSQRAVRNYLGPLLGPEGGAGLLRFVRAVDLAAAEAALEVLVVEPPPTLIGWGELDHLHSPAYGRHLAARIPGAVWTPISGAGHLLPQERPERVAEEIAGFLGEREQVAG